MERSINFVQNRRRKLTKYQASDLKILKATAVFFALLILTFLIVFGIYFYLQLQIKNVANEQKSLESQIAAKKNIEQEVVVSAAKLKILMDLFASRYDKQAAISYFSEIFGDQVTIKDINYDAGNKILSLRLQSKSIFILEEVFTKLANPEITEKFGNINKSELNRDGEGAYSMAITLSLKEDEKPKATAAPKKAPANSKTN